MCIFLLGAFRKPGLGGHGPYPGPIDKNASPQVPPKNPNPAEVLTSSQLWYYEIRSSRQYRGSRPEMFCKTSVVENVAKSSGKRQCWSRSIKKKTLTQVFSYEFCEIFKSSFLIENLWVAASAHIYFIKYRSNRRRYKEGIC